MATGLRGSEWRQTLDESHDHEMLRLHRVCWQRYIRDVQGWYLRRKMAGWFTEKRTWIVVWFDMTMRPIEFGVTELQGHD